MYAILSAPISKVIGFLPPDIPRILINRTIVHPAAKVEEEDNSEEERDFRSDYIFDAYLLGFCDDISRSLEKQIFCKDETDKDLKPNEGKLLATLKEDDDHYDAQDWSSTRVPANRIFLFPGAQAPLTLNDDDSVLTYNEIAHCDGCEERIEGNVFKCVSCFDYDLCCTCYKRESRKHFKGTHKFQEQEAAAAAHIPEIASPTS
jgi:hypothetical protein